MLLPITTTRSPATDLGFLLHKHPARLQSFSLPFGQAHLFYPEATEERCTAALLLDVDPIGLIRRGVRFPRLDQYVNDRPYVASSFLSVAIARVFNTALGGNCSTRPELAEEPMPLCAGARSGRREALLGGRG
jgi:RNA repair, ligase-Pnkp-associating, region of Hen1